MKKAFLIGSILALSATAAYANEKHMGVGKADVNNDGVITRAEYIQHAGDKFDKLDTNKDGQLSAAEQSTLKSKMSEVKKKWKEGAEPADTEAMKEENIKDMKPGR